MINTCRSASPSRVHSFFRLLSSAPCLQRNFTTSTAYFENNKEKPKKADKPKKTDEEKDWETYNRPRYVPVDPETHDPIARANAVLKWDFRELWDVLRGKRPDFSFREAAIFPQFCDILIVGGGIMGSVIAYYLKQRLPKALTIVVVEKDPTYVNAASTNSFGAIRTQFSQEVNIRASVFGAQFLRTMKEHLSVYGKSLAYWLPTLNAAVISPPHASWVQKLNELVGSVEQTNTCTVWIPSLRISFFPFLPGRFCGCWNIRKVG